MAKKAMKEEQENRNSSMQSKYRGVRKRKWGKWVSEIRLPHSRERIWLGSYDTPEKAARAFDAAQFCLRGGASDFNFPDNPPTISGGRSLTPPEIREAAARFANAQDNNNNIIAGREESGLSEIRPESPSTSVSEAATSSATTLECDMSFFDMLPALFANAQDDNIIAGGEESDLSEFRPESPSTSVSELATSSATTLDCDMSLFDMLPADFEIFPGFDDLSDGFSGDRFTEILPIEDYGEEIFDGSFFLWDF